MQSFCVRAFALAPWLVVTACSGTDDPAATLAEEYAVRDGLCSATVGASSETLQTPFEVRIVAARDTSPAGCSQILVFSSETCVSGCSPTPCEACLHDLEGTDVMTGTLGPASTDATFDSCTLRDNRGGLSEDLIFHGAVLMGSFTHVPGAADPLRISFDVDGEARVGSSGTDEPASGRCSLVGVPAS